MKAFVATCCVLVVVCIVVIPLVDKSRQSVNYGPYQLSASLKVIAFYIYEYEEAHGELPRDYDSNEGGRILSWRVRVASAFDSATSVDTKSSWDSKSNLEAAKGIPQGFRMNQFNPELFPFGCRTQILGVRSKQGVWNGELNTEVLIVNGQPVRCVGVGPELAVFWTKPIDLSVEDVVWLLERDPKGERIKYASLADGCVVEAPFKWEIIPKGQ